MSGAVSSRLVIVGLDGLKAQVGRELGVTRWRSVTQDEVSKFGELTGDTYWLHTDPARARSSPFGGTIAHGFFTLALAPALTRELYEVVGPTFGVSYGIDRVRFPAPVIVGGRIRLRALLKSVEDRDGGRARFTLGLTFEQEGSEKPVCIADWLGVYAYDC